MLSNNEHTPKSRAYRAPPLTVIVPPVLNRLCLLPGFYDPEGGEINSRRHQRPMSAPPGMAVARR